MWELRVYLRKEEEIEATDVSGGGSVDLAMVVGQERQRGLTQIERERERERERLKNEKWASTMARSM